MMVCVRAAIWVINTGPKSGCELPTIFGSDRDDGVSAAIWVIHTSPTWSHFLTVCLYIFDET